MERLPGEKRGDTLSMPQEAARHEVRPERALGKARWRTATAIKGGTVDDEDLAVWWVLAFA
jgi:hypothetical protein